MRRIAARNAGPLANYSATPKNVDKRNDAKALSFDQEEAICSAVAQQFGIILHNDDDWMEEVLRYIYSNSACQEIQ